MTAQALLDAAEGFAAAGIDRVTTSRRASRELMVSDPGLAESIHGAILYDETIRQRRDGTPMIKTLTDAAMQQALRHRPSCDQMARRGEYSPAAERTAA